MTTTDTTTKNTTTATRNKILEGVVVSDKMQKTVVVLVKNYLKDLKYKKYYKTSKRFKAHDEENRYKVGDKVQIVETVPISKDKHFKVIYQ